MFPTVFHLPRASQRRREERLTQTEWQKLNRQAIGRRRKPHRRRRLREFGATKRLLTATRAGETRRRLPSAQADRFGLRDARNFTLGPYVARHQGRRRALSAFLAERR
jgi:hypothetical protein